MNRLAVLIPAFNNQAGLNRSLMRLGTDPAPFDIVVVDDGSHPLIELPDRFGDHAVSLYRLPANRGIEGALNEGLEQILRRDHEYIARLDAGDVSLPGRFEAQMAFLDAHGDHALVGSFVEMVDLEGRTLFVYSPPQHDAGIRKALRYTNCILHPSMMIRASLFRDLGPYSTEFPAAEDYELVVRASGRHKLANLPTVFVKCELNPSGISTARRRRQVLSRIQVELRHFDPGSMHSYLGLAANLGILPVPQSLLLAGKRLLSRIPL